MLWEDELELESKQVNKLVLFKNIVSEILVLFFGLEHFGDNWNSKIFQSWQ